MTLAKTTQRRSALGRTPPAVVDEQGFAIPESLKKRKLSTFGRVQQPRRAAEAAKVRVFHQLKGERRIVRRGGRGSSAAKKGEDESDKQDEEDEKDDQDEKEDENAQDGAVSSEEEEDLSSGDSGAESADSIGDDEDFVDSDITDSNVKVVTRSTAVQGARAERRSERRPQRVSSSGASSLVPVSTATTPRSVASRMDGRARKPGTFRKSSIHPLLSNILQRGDEIASRLSGAVQRAAASPSSLKALSETISFVLEIFLKSCAINAETSSPASLSPLAARLTKLAEKTLASSNGFASATSFRRLREALALDCLSALRLVPDETTEGRHNALFQQPSSQFRGFQSAFCQLFHFLFAQLDAEAALSPAGGAALIELLNTLSTTGVRRLRFAATLASVGALGGLCVLRETLAKETRRFSLQGRQLSLQAQIQSRRSNLEGASISGSGESGGANGAIKQRVRELRDAERRLTLLIEVVQRDVLQRRAVDVFGATRIAAFKALSIGLATCAPNLAFNADVSALVLSRLSNGILSSEVADLRRQELFVSLTYVHLSCHAAVDMTTVEEDTRLGCVEFLKEAVPFVFFASEACALTDPELSAFALDALAPVAQSSSQSSELGALMLLHVTQLLQVLWIAREATVLEAAARLLCTRCFDKGLAEMNAASSSCGSDRRGLVALLRFALCHLPRSSQGALAFPLSGKIAQAFWNLIPSLRNVEGILEAVERQSLDGEDGDFSSLNEEACLVLLHFACAAVKKLSADEAVWTCSYSSNVGEPSVSLNSRPASSHRKRRTECQRLRCAGLELNASSSFFSSCPSLCLCSDASPFFLARLADASWMQLLKRPEADRDEEEEALASRRFESIASSDAVLAAFPRLLRALVVSETAPRVSSKRRPTHSVLQCMQQQQLFVLLFLAVSPPRCFERHLAEAALPGDFGVLKTRISKDGDEDRTVSLRSSTPRCSCAFLQSNAGRNGEAARHLLDRLRTLALLDSSCLSAGTLRALFAALGNLALLLPSHAAPDVALVEAGLLQSLTHAVAALRKVVICLSDEECAEDLQNDGHSAVPRLSPALASPEGALRSQDANSKMEQALCKVAAFAKYCARSGEVSSLFPAVEGALSVLHLRVLIAAARQETRDNQTEKTHGELPDVPSTRCLLFAMNILLTVYELLAHGLMLLQRDFLRQTEASQRLRESRNEEEETRGLEPETETASFSEGDFEGTASETRFEKRAESLRRLSREAELLRRRATVLCLSILETDKSQLVLCGALRCVLLFGRVEASLLAQGKASALRLESLTFVEFVFSAAQQRALVEAFGDFVAPLVAEAQASEGKRRSRGDSFQPRSSFCESASALGLEPSSEEESPFAALLLGCAEDESLASRVEKALEEQAQSLAVRHSTNWTRQTPPTDERRDASETPGEEEHDVENKKKKKKKKKGDDEEEEDAGDLVLERAVASALRVHCAELVLRCCSLSTWRTGLAASLLLQLQSPEPRLQRVATALFCFLKKKNCGLLVRLLVQAVRLTHSQQLLDPLEEGEEVADKSQRDVLSHLRQFMAVAAAKLSPVTSAPQLREVLKSILDASAAARLSRRRERRAREALCDSSQKAKVKCRCWLPCLAPLLPKLVPEAAMPRLRESLQASVRRNGESWDLSSERLMLDLQAAPFCQEEGGLESSDEEGRQTAHAVKAAAARLLPREIDRSNRISTTTNNKINNKSNKKSSHTSRAEKEKKAVVEERREEQKRPSTPSSESDKEQNYQDKETPSDAFSVSCSNSPFLQQASLSGTSKLHLQPLSVQDPVDQHHEEEEKEEEEKEQDEQPQQDEEEEEQIQQDEEEEEQIQQDEEEEEQIQQDEEEEEQIQQDEEEEEQILQERRRTTSLVRTENTKKRKLPTSVPRKESKRIRAPQTSDSEPDVDQGTEQDFSSEGGLADPWLYSGVDEKENLLFRTQPASSPEEEPSHHKRGRRRSGPRRSSAASSEHGSESTSFAADLFEF